MSKMKRQKVIAIVCARMKSTRFPGKVMWDINGSPMIEHVLRRASQLPRVSDVILAIPDTPDNNKLMTAGQRSEYCDGVCMGSELDVLHRMLSVIRETQADAFYRVTADNPIIDSGLALWAWQEFEKADCDHAITHGGPDGTHIEIVKASVFKKLDEMVGDDAGLREHPTLGVYKYYKVFKHITLEVPDDLKRDYRLTVDEIEDAIVVRRLFKEHGDDVTLASAIKFLDAHLDISAINAGVEQQTRIDTHYADQISPD